MPRNLTLLTLALLSLSSCAGVKFTKDNSKEDQGFLYYPPKPYLVVDRGKDTATLRVISLPDLSKPRRVWQKRGWGNASFGFKTQNGMLTEFNASSDNQGDELLGAIASLGTAAAALDTAEAALIAADAAVNTEGAGTAAAGAAPYPVIAVQSANAELQRVVNGIQPAPGSALSPGLVAERNVLTAFRAALVPLETVTYDPNDPASVRTLVGLIANVKAGVKPILAGLRSSRAVLDSIVKHPNTAPEDVRIGTRAISGVTQVITYLAGFAEATSGPEIYEIVSVGGSIQLRRVQLTE